MRREERVTVQGPVKEQQPDRMSHRGTGGGRPALKESEGHRVMPQTTVKAVDHPWGSGWGGGGSVAKPLQPRLGLEGYDGGLLTVTIAPPPPTPSSAGLAGFAMKVQAWGGGGIADAPVPRCSFCHFLCSLRCVLHCCRARQDPPRHWSPSCPAFLRPASLSSPPCIPPAAPGLPPGA